MMMLCVFLQHIKQTTLRNEKKEKKKVIKMFTTLGFVILIFILFYSVCVCELVAEEHIINLLLFVPAQLTQLTHLTTQHSTGWMDGWIII
jgi:cadmium resistance protein CadD (predicted permease)